MEIKLKQKLNDDFARLIREFMNREEYCKLSLELKEQGIDIGYGTMERIVKRIQDIRRSNIKCVVPMIKRAYENYHNSLKQSDSEIEVYRKEIDLIKRKQKHMRNEYKSIQENPMINLGGL